MDKHDDKQTSVQQSTIELIPNYEKYSNILAGQVTQAHRGKREWKKKKGGEAKKDGETSGE